MNLKKSLKKFIPAFPLLLGLLCGLLMPPFACFLNVCLGEANSFASTLELLQILGESWVGVIISCETLMLVYMFLTFEVGSKKYTWLLPVSLGWYALSLISLVEYNMDGMRYFVENTEYIGDSTFYTFYVLGSGFFGMVGSILAFLAFLAVVLLVADRLELLSKIKKLKPETQSLLTIVGAGILLLNALWNMLESGYFWLVLFINRMEYMGDFTLKAFIREIYYASNSGVYALIGLMFPVAVFLLYFMERKKKGAEVVEAPEEHTAEIVTEETETAEVAEVAETASEETTVEEA